MLADEKTDFIAISHVWSDGTGKGTQKHGDVNSCLVNYWVDIARSLNCEGI